MNIFSNPKWLQEVQFTYPGFESIPDSVFSSINNDLDKMQTDTPLVSIIIAAWNEEVNILRCIASLSKTKTDIPLEIVVVNNNSTDNTAKTLEQLHVKKVGVNEQNEQAVGFYKHMGFEVIGRSDFDGMGKPFPLLFMELKNKKSL